MIFLSWCKSDIHCFGLLFGSYLLEIKRHLVREGRNSCSCNQASRILMDRTAVLLIWASCCFMLFFLFCVCSNTGERGGPGEVPNTAVSVPLQGDRTKGDGQVSLSPGLCGPQRCGMAPSASLKLKIFNVALLNNDKTVRLNQPHQ